MPRACARRVFAVVAALAAGACSAIPTGHNQAVRELDREAAAIANRIETSRLRLNDDGHPETTASGLAPPVDDPARRRGHDAPAASAALTDGLRRRTSPRAAATRPFGRYAMPTVVATRARFADSGYTR
jgi:hypothetical protein